MPDSAARGDLRVQKTIKAIRNALCQLLLEMPFEDITVSLLCERAMVNRKTFYRHYANLFTVLSELQREIAVPFVEQTRGMRYPEDLEQVVRLFMSHSADQGELYDRIVCNAHYASILQSIIREMEEERYLNSAPLPGWPAPNWALYMEFATSTQLLLYRKWVEDGRIVPFEEMVDLSCQLITHGGSSIAAIGV